MIWIGCFSSWCTAPTMSSLEWFSTRDVAIYILWELVQFQPSYYIICLSFIPKDIPKETQIWSTHVFWSIHSLKIENPPTTKSSAKFETYIHISVCFLLIMWHCLLVWFLCRIPCSSGSTAVRIILIYFYSYNHLGNVKYALQEF